MNARQRMLARKAGRPAGYRADGGIVSSVSGAIERVGRAFGTEKAKKIKAAEDDLKRPPAPQETETQKRQDAFNRAGRMDAQERDALEEK